MSKPRLLLALTLGSMLTLSGSALAQDDVGSGAAQPSPVAPADTRLVELEALVPEYFAGIPLRENMQAVPGELLTSRMDADERSAFEAMLEANDKTLADYAAANAPVLIDDSSVIVIQPHRVTGIDAAATLDTWGRILGLNAERPAVAQTVIAGQEVLSFTDGARPDFPVLHLFASGDVVWMVVAEDEAVVEEAVRTLATASLPETDE